MGEADGGKPVLAVEVIAPRFGEVAQVDEKRVLTSVHRFIGDDGCAPVRGKQGVTGRVDALLRPVQ